MEDGEYVEMYVFFVIEWVLVDLCLDSVLLEGMNVKIVEGVIMLLEKNYFKIGNLVCENVDKMDNVLLILLIEDKVGQDF